MRAVGFVTGRVLGMWWWKSGSQYPYRIGRVEYLHHGLYVISRDQIAGAHCINMHIPFILTPFECIGHDPGCTAYADLRYSDFDIWWFRHSGISWMRQVWWYPLRLEWIEGKQGQQTCGLSSPDFEGGQLHLGQGFRSRPRLIPSVEITLGHCLFLDFQRLMGEVGSKTTEVLWLLNSDFVLITWYS